MHVVRARGKATIVSLCKILNQFDKGYSVLHDADRKTIVGRRTGKERANPAWSANEKIAEITADGRTKGTIRVLASVPNFEEAFFGEEAEGNKPYSAIARMTANAEFFRIIKSLLDCLVDLANRIPNGANEWDALTDLEAAVAAFDGP